MPELPKHRAAIIDAIDRVLAEHGPMTEKQLSAALHDAGVNMGRDPAGMLADLLETDDLPFVLPLADERLVHLPTLMLGRIFTHRLSEAEIEHGFVEIIPDLDAIATLTDQGFLRLADGTAVTEIFPDLDDELLAERGIPVDAIADEAFLLPPTLLSDLGFAADNIAGFRYSTEGLEIVPLADHDITDGSSLGAALAANLGAALAAKPGGGIDAIPEQLDIVLWTACANDATLFRIPQPPLSEVLDAAGLVRAGEQIAPAGFDFATWRAERRLSSIMLAYELSEDEALAVLGTVTMFEDIDIRDGAAEANRNEGAPDPLLVRKMLHFLVEPAVAEAVLIETIGADREGATALRLLTETLEPMAPRAARPALRWLRGKAHERLGAIPAAEAAFDEAESLDPAWPPALFELARYAGDRGDAERGLALLRRAGAPPDDDLVQILERYRPPERTDMARNQPCWCGSGRRYKQCHQNRERLPLADRAGWLCQKAAIYLSDGPWRGAVIDVADLRAEYRESPDALLEATTDPLVVDTVLFEGGAFADFLAERGELLPHDELLLAQQWLLVERSVYEVESVQVGSGFTARDLRTGDRQEVREKTASRQLRTGMLICTRLAPAGDDTTQCFGGIEPVELHERDELIALLDADPNPLELVAFLSRRFAPPQIRNTEGQPLVVCEAVLQTSDTGALTAALDKLYERVTPADSNELHWIEQVVTHGMPRVRASLRLDGDHLHVETNSEERMEQVLDTLAAIEPAPTLVDETRTTADDMTDAVRRGERPAGTDSTGVLEPTDPAVAAALDEFVRQYEKAWLDDAIPALAGLTPRQAADDPTRRPDLIRLLASFPPSEGQPGMMNPDRLRAALGLE